MLKKARILPEHFKKIWRADRDIVVIVLHSSLLPQWMFPHFQAWQVLFLLMIG